LYHEEISELKLKGNALVLNVADLFAIALMPRVAVRW
jgi:hypothetical protein